MIRIAIVEDDDLFVSQVQQFLADYQREKKEAFDIRVYRDGDGITADYRPEFDIILMDIEMRFVNGMTAAEEIRRIDSEVIIIFITNLPQYAIRGYEVGALDYILKPLSYFVFSQKLERAIGRLRQKGKHYVTVPFRGGIQRLDVSDIYYIESEGHTLVYHTSRGNLCSSGTMKAAETRFEGMHFSRGNKGYLINLKHVEAIEEKCAVVKGEKLLISRPRMNDFMRDLTKYWGEVE